MLWPAPESGWRRRDEICEAVWWWWRRERAGFEEEEIDDEETEGMIEERDWMDDWYLERKSADKVSEVVSVVVVVVVVMVSSADGLVVVKVRCSEVVVMVASEMVLSSDIGCGREREDRERSICFRVNVSI